MSPALQRFRLAQLPQSPRVLITFFVVLLGIGYLVAVLNVYLTYAGADGRASMTPQDLKLRLYGNRKATLLESVISPGGKMSQYMPNAADREQILAWVHAGATETGFTKVQPLFARNCAGCHQNNGPASFRPLTNYQEVATVAQVDRGESLATWARIAHTHIQSLALMYFALGILFCFCGYPERLKAVVVSVPFLAVFLDFSTRALVRFQPEMVHGVMASGALLGLATAVMIAGVLHELWLSPAARAR